jgi:hypothetical protein
MAPIHQRMDRYHDLPPPPPIPLKLKPKTLKKLSQQAARGQPLYLIVGPHAAAATATPRPMGGSMHPPPLPPHPPHPNQHPSRSFAVVHPRIERQQRMPGPANSVGTATSGSDSLKSMSFSSAQGLMDSQNRFRPDNFNMRLRAHQQLFPWNPHNQSNSHSSKSSANWVRHLTSDDDVEEEEEEEEEEISVGAANRNMKNNNKVDNISSLDAVNTRASSSVRPEYQLGPSDRNARLVGEIQLSSRVASMTIADVSPRFAFKVSPRIRSFY